MRKIYLPALFIFLGLSAGCGNPKDIDPNPIQEPTLSENLRFLSSDALAGRATGSEGIEEAAAYIEERLQENGIVPYFETFRHSFEVEGKEAYNIVGFKEGTDPILKDQFIIIGAHYDHVGVAEKEAEDVIYNGANDNASGTASVLELIKLLKDKDLKRSLLFTFFSAEEMGLVGAKELASRLKNDKLDPYVMLNLEMLGVPMNDREYQAYLTGFQHSNLAEKFNEFSDQQVLGYLPEAEQYNLFKRSDNYPFYEAFAIPAQTISTFDFTNYEFYHHVDDEFERMDITHMGTLINNLVPGIVAMANTAEKEIKLKEE